MLEKENRPVSSRLSAKSPTRSSRPGSMRSTLQSRPQSRVSTTASGKRVSTITMLVKKKTLGTKRDIHLNSTILGGIDVDFVWIPCCANSALTLLVINV